MGAYRSTGTGYISYSSVVFKSFRNKRYNINPNTLHSRLEAPMGVTGATALLLSFLTVRMSSSYVISRPYRRFDNTGMNTRQKSSTVHNVTVHCGYGFALINTVLQCQRDFYKLAVKGYPWPAGSNVTHSTNNPNATGRDCCITN